MTTRAFRATYRGLTWLGEKIGMIVTPILLALFYVLVVSVVAIVMKIFSPDMLHKKLGDEQTYWKTRSDFDTSRERLKRPF